MSRVFTVTEHRFSQTPAAKMLAEGLRSAAQERGVSLREIGRRLGYRQPVVLSHMASGRVPVPIDRAVDIARHVGIASDRFLEAVLRQHHPRLEWGLITGKPEPLLSDLERVLGKTDHALTPAHERILREVAEDRWPAERWLSIPEVAAVKLLRELFPDLATKGLSSAELSTLRTCAELLNEQDEQ